MLTGTKLDKVVAYDKGSLPTETWNTLTRW